MDAARVLSETAAWRDHVIVCGLGTVAVRVVESLLHAGVPLVVVDSGHPTPFHGTCARQGVPIIQGDCTQPEVLRQAGAAGSRAIVVVINDDMICLQTALMVRSLNANARVVIRLFNLHLAHHLRTLPAEIVAISLSAAVAPVFTLAARSRALRAAFNVQGRSWAVGMFIVPGESAYAVEHWRSSGMVVLARGLARERLAWFPAPDRLLTPGEMVLVVTAPEMLLALGDDPEQLASALRDPGARTWSDQARIAVARREARLSRAIRTSHLLWARANRLLRLALIALLSLVLGSVLILHFFFPLRFLDATYFTVTLVTTVGLGDYNFMHAAGALKLFGVIVMLGGASLMAVFYGLIAEFVLNARIEALVGESAESVDDHYVVAGLGTVGFRVASTLREAGEAVAVIDADAEGRFVPQVRASGIPLIVGDATLEDTLRRARIERARAFIAVTSNDLANIEGVLNARALCPEARVVLRVFDPTLAIQARQGLDIHSSFSASQIGAPAFVAAALGEDAPQVLSLHMDKAGGQGVMIVQLRAVEGDQLVGCSIGEVAANHGGAALLYGQESEHGTGNFAPPLDRVLAEGDVLVLAVPEREPPPMRGPAMHSAQGSTVTRDTVEQAAQLAADT